MLICLLYQPHPQLAIFQDVSLFGKVDKTVPASRLGSNRHYVLPICPNSAAFLHKVDLRYQPQFQPVVSVCGGAAVSHSLTEEQ